MEYLGFTGGLLLPWLGGTLWLMFVESGLNRKAAPSRLRQVGYGFFLGYMSLSATVLGLNTWVGQVSWSMVMIMMGLIAAGGGLALWLVYRKPAQKLPTLRPLKTAQKLLLAILASWILLHIFFATIEVLSQPVYPWDAWLAWVYRGKAWFLSGGIKEVVSPTAWAAATSPDIYTINAASYPRFASVIPYWAALSLGRWSEILVNIPTLLAGLAIGMALYGQCRESGMNTLTGMIACYLLFSIPLFGTHIALAGYADIWMAGFAGLGFMALVRGAAGKDRWQTLLGLCMIALAIKVKHEGAVWFLAALLFVSLTTFRLRTNLVAGLMLVVTVFLAWLLGVSHVEIPFAGTLGFVNDRLEIPFIGSFALEVHDVWRAYWDNFFTMGSWNLLWVLVAASLLLALPLWNSRQNAAERQAGGIFITMFLATQIFIFGFTDQGIWADTYTAINRLPLHFVPALIYTAAIVVFARITRATEPPGVPEARRG